MDVHRTHEFNTKFNSQEEQALTPVSLKINL
jgi:hypothetical protein